MAMIDWRIEGEAFGNCNCDYGCPCQFELRPTHGSCKGFEVFRIAEGHYGGLSLAGVKAALLYSWPGPIFEGNGEMQAIVDQSATPEQRAALVEVLHGGQTDEAATHWWVYHAMSDVRHPPLFLPITLEVDIAARTGRAEIPGVLTSSGHPIRSPATGGEHRVRIDIPGGIEFEQAEVGSASSQASGRIAFVLEDSYGQFNRLHHTGRGVVH